MQSQQQTFRPAYGQKFSHHFELTLVSDTPWVEENVRLVFSRSDLRFKREISLGDITTNRGAGFGAKLCDSLLVEHSSDRIPMELIRAAPIWIDTLILKDGIVLGYSITDHERTVIALRVTQALIYFLESLEPASYDQNQTYFLLLRLKYNLLRRYDQHLRSEEAPSIDIFEGEFDREFLRTHKLCAEKIIEQPDLVRMSLRNLYGKEISLTGEADTLLYAPAPIQHGSLYTTNPDIVLQLFAEEHEGAYQVDYLLRRFYLYHDDLTGVSRYLSTLAKRKKSNGGNRILRNFIAFFIQWGRQGIILSAILFFLFVFSPTTFFSTSHRPAIDFMVAIFLLISLIVPTLAMLAAWFEKPFHWMYQMFYPFAMRVPAMIVVGTFATNQLLHVGDIVDLPPGLEILIVVFLAAASLGYMLTEVGSKKLPNLNIFYRCLALFLYTAAISTWVSVINIFFDMFYNFRSDYLLGGTGIITLALESIAKIPILHLMIYIGLILMIGVFTQIFWEDRSLAEPL